MPHMRGDGVAGADRPVPDDRAGRPREGSATSLQADVEATSRSPRHRLGRSEATESAIHCPPPIPRSQRVIVSGSTLLFLK